MLAEPFLIFSGQDEMTLVERDQVRELGSPASVCLQRAAALPGRRSAFDKHLHSGYLLAIWLSDYLAVWFGLLVVGWSI